MGEPVAVWSDGVVVLSPFVDESDARAHLAGEDDDTARWLSGGPSTLVAVASWIRENQAHWALGAPRRACAVRFASTGALIGMVEANTMLPSLAPGEVNVSYGLHAAWRRRGLAARAVAGLLMFAHDHLEARVAVIRAAPDNVSSIALGERLGFARVEAQSTPELTWLSCPIGAVVEVRVERAGTVEDTFAAVTNGDLLRATGGRAHSYALHPGGVFRLDFDGRGSVEGAVVHWKAHEALALTWNVTGFDRPPERTVVTLRLAKNANAGATTLTLTHRGIPSEVSALAKREAWARILDALAAV